jgi:hypothetical protein
VEAFGYWGDILNGPYHAFGTAAPLAPDEGLFQTANREFTHTAMDVSEHNVKVRGAGPVSDSAGVVGAACTVGTRMAVF